MENKYVHKTYNSISKEFHRTRYSLWQCVKRFLSELSDYSIVADVGIGNGKYAKYRHDLVYFGNDMCVNLLEYAKKNTQFLIQANGLSLPYRDDAFDATLSVAVLHHVSTYSRRKMFIDEMFRVTKPGGKIFFTVWALEQNVKDNWKSLGNGDFLIPWENNEQRYYHLFTVHELHDLMKGLCYDVYFEKDNWCVTAEKLTA